MMEPMWTSSSTTKILIKSQDHIVVINDYRHFYVNQHFTNWNVCGVPTNGRATNEEIEVLFSYKSEKEAQNIIDYIWEQLGGKEID